MMMMVEADRLLPKMQLGKNLLVVKEEDTRIKTAYVDNHRHLTFEIRRRFMNETTNTIQNTTVNNWFLKNHFFLRRFIDMQIKTKKKKKIKEKMYT